MLKNKTNPTGLSHDMRYVTVAKEGLDVCLACIKYTNEVVNLTSEARVYMYI